jgi:glutamate formiminotransferase/formiminotetrahydrofolate cyclodeaminase
MQQVVECVPNFSNGRDADVYERIAGVIREVSEVQVLDVSADADHNRTVITFVGSIAGVEEAAFRAIAEAARLIDLDHHTGEHPRIGATDVCPFIPVRGVTMEDCVAIARRLGRRVGEELGIAVYLYGAAATRPERESLSAIRRGEYEGWKQEVATRAERRPDFGPAEPRTWGATVIGARPFLIAYNLYLNSDRADVAEQIARAVRYSSGGLRYVQAKGFLVEGQAQVSMNLTNFEKTAIARVQEMVRREAAHHGLSITRAELVGLIPQKALVEAAKWYLQLDDLGDAQVLENRLQEPAAGGPARPSNSPEGFIDAVAAATATPGGGAVAGLAGALSAALTQMVAGLTVGRKNYVDVSEQALRLLGDAEKLRVELTRAISEDTAAFEAVMAVARNKELDGEARAAAMEDATRHAAEVPLRVARLSRDAGRLAAQVARIGNVNAVSDAAAGAIMARAAVQVAGLNVKINGVSLRDQALAAAWREELTGLEADAEEAVAAALAAAAERGGL